MVRLPQVCPVPSSGPQLSRRQLLDIARLCPKNAYACSQFTGGMHVHCATVPAHSSNRLRRNAQWHCHWLHRLDWFFWVQHRNLLPDAVLLRLHLQDRAWGHHANLLSELGTPFPQRSSGLRDRVRAGRVSCGVSGRVNIPPHFEQNQRPETGKGHRQITDCFVGGFIELACRLARLADGSCGSVRSANLLPCRFLWSSVALC